MAHIIDLDKLKRKLRIDASDTGQDTALNNHTADVRELMEIVIGNFSQNVALTFRLAGTGTPSIDVPRAYDKTLQSISQIDIYDTDNVTTVTLPAGSWYFDSTEYVVYRDPDYVYTTDPESPDDGSTFPTVEKVSKPIQITATTGWVDPSPDNYTALPTWLQNDWVMFTKLYIEQVLRDQPFVLEDDKIDKKRMRKHSMDEKTFKQKIYNYYFPKRRMAS